MTVLRSLAARIGRAGDRQAVAHGLLAAGIVFSVFVAAHAAGGDWTTAYDARVYWEASALHDPYAALRGGGFDTPVSDGVRLFPYKYPPPLAQVLSPLHLVPWPVFLAAWTFSLFALYLRMAGKWAFVVLLVFPPVMGDLWLGNINLVIGMAILAGFRRPAAWAFPILTKLTPAVGLLWFGFRREWRSLGIALGATAAVALGSAVVAPDLWRDYLATVGNQVGPAVDAPFGSIPIPFVLRFAVAVLLVAWGARTDRRWVLPVAVAISAPFLWWNVLAMVVASITLADPDASVPFVPLRIRRHARRLARGALGGEPLNARERAA